jgi:hypothetical protein
MEQNQGWSFTPDKQFNLAVIFRNKQFGLEIPVLVGVAMELIGEILHKSGD